MKKTLTAILAVLMCATAFSGCAPAKQEPAKVEEKTASETTKTDETKKEEPKKEEVKAEDKKEDEKPAEATAVDTSKEVTLTWMYTGNNVVDEAAVEEQVNAYLKEKINAKLDMIWAGWGDFDDKATMAINGGDPVDIYFTSSWTRNEYVSYSKKGVYVRLDDPANNLLEKYAPELFKSIPAVMADAASVDGASGLGIYAVPTYKEIAQQYNWELNDAVLTKYGYTKDDIKSYYDLGPILEKVKQGEGADFYPLGGDITVLERAATNNDLVDDKGLLSFHFDPVNPSKSPAVITSEYESPEFKQFVEKQHEYYKKGLINPAASNINTMATSWTDTQTSGKYLIGAFPYYPGIELAWSATRGYKVDVKPIQAGIISSTSARGAMNAISVTSKNQDRAMMLLNLVNTDAKLRTLLTYGVEGVHYTKEGDRIKFTDKKKDYGVWPAGLARLSLLPLTVDDPANLYELFDKFNNVESVPILGFAFDREPVKSEMAALANVVDEFQYPLLSGSIDPATELPKFIEKLKANGIDKVIAEANAQVKAFMDAKAK